MDRNSAANPSQATAANIGPAPGSGISPEVISGGCNPKLSRATPTTGR